MSQSYFDQLAEAYEAWGLEPSPPTWQKLVDYLALLRKWNKVYNLTAIRDEQEMFVKHLLDSLAVAPFIDSERLIDVGTGGGLPGIPLAILFPERQIDLLDSNSKKTRFLIQAKAELDLQNTQVFHMRVEDYQPETLYDGVVSRAFASLDDMLHWTGHLLKENGYWWAMKSQKTQDELAQLPNFARITQVFELQVPHLQAERTLIQVQKI
ncbi:16S rRNA (guanine(527)-N(7))-methyltransferase RsmG [Hydrogenovibrio marinus]|uniref:Ribosomal RNA small subunit methyltransferase G n=1 Tax=Hydrogenovibrio marinus TaxID=28885 RepID=A0A066ZV39_HYDMR|nr:16S rRNA (guanine(527)-N(7))-methyltransferase RsmG [Hydrogenovibrio marinus]KDN96134.1 16S rRNA methyltransferase [Hydrogenovibrio marinus]BBN60689.1 ribosomal RNA small subunit methyltransferase G [Hydrogenovibrio marinus]